MNYFRQISSSVLLLASLINFTHGQSKPWVTLENAQPLVVDKHTNEITVSFRIREGMHINANEISDEYLIPTTVKINWPEEIFAGKSKFPQPQLLTLAGSDVTMEVFYSKISITTPVAFHENFVGGNFFVTGELYYQPCNDTKCFYPETLDFGLEIEIQ